ncbi:MAG: hypothetical protein HYX81_01740 [Chloroflexi bacterium]|nr:hypothetical protein [Chloroflexota bacterium]
MLNEVTDDSPAFTRIEIDRNLSLHFFSGQTEPSDYSNNRIQKGLQLVCNEENLAEEGTGFGVPIIKLGHETIFPGSARVHLKEKNSSSTIMVTYDLNLVPRMTRKGTIIKSEAFYKTKEWFSWLHRTHPSWRKALAWNSNRIRATAGLETKMESIASLGSVAVAYAVSPLMKTIMIEADFRKLKAGGCTEKILANEQGANYFDHYQDSNGISLADKAIGTWDETFARKAWFIAPDKSISFVLTRLQGARMFRGRELAKGRLAWAGLNYVLSPDTLNFAYEIQLE